jgi:hypothetical protein
MKLKWTALFASTEGSSPKPSFNQSIEFDQVFAVRFGKINADEFRIAFGSVIPIAGFGRSRIRFALKVVIETGCETLVGNFTSRKGSTFALDRLSLRKFREEFIELR